MKRRWVCPLGCGSNVLAPERMRKDNALRYCLDCTKKTGKLVERVCPAADGRRERKATRRREKRASDAEKAIAERREATEREREARRRAAPRMKKARAALGKAVRLKVWTREGVTLDARWLSLRPGDGFTHGRAGRTGFVEVGYKSGVVATAAIIVHELTHIALHRLRHPKRRGHGQTFRGLYLAAACEFFGINEADVLAKWRQLLQAEDALVAASKDNDPLGTGLRKERQAYILDDAVIAVAIKERAS